MIYGGSQILPLPSKNYVEKPLVLEALRNLYKFFPKFHFSQDYSVINPILTLFRMGGGGGDKALPVFPL